MSDEPLIPSDWIRCPEPGVVVRRPLSNDRYADLCMMIMGGAELKIGRKYDLGYEEIYTYAHWFWGFEALLSW
ncbi:MAG TPA: hypothetical protein VEF04_09550, partial [Blastocatellia bacterium]|nr:hypothetical protein [Blastocatellia bacterium]